MNENERRQHLRKKSSNLVDYVLLDEEGNHVSRGMGRTRDVSEEGLLLETRAPLDEGQIVLITMGLEEDLVGIRGRVIYTTVSEDKGYWTGIEFLELDEVGKQVLRPYIMAIETGEEE